MFAASSFSTAEAYLIEDGKVTHPVKGATLIGNGPDALTRVSMIGNDLALDSGIGTCGKEGQSVPVGVGQPTLKIDGLTVGGTGLSASTQLAEHIPDGALIGLPPDYSLPAMEVVRALIRRMREDCGCSACRCSDCAPTF